MKRNVGFETEFLISTSIFKSSLYGPRMTPQIVELKERGTWKYYLCAIYPKQGSAECYENSPINVIL